MASYNYVLDEPARLLFVDDDPILREFAKVNLSSDAASVDVAENGIDAFDQIRRRSYDLIVSDLEMPGMDGFALLEAVRSNPETSRLPVVVATGREDVLAIDRAFAVGATSFVVKPLHWRLLSYQLRFVLRNARIETELRRAREPAAA